MGSGKKLTGCKLFRWWDVSAAWDYGVVNEAFIAVVANYLTCLYVLL